MAYAQRREMARHQEEVLLDRLVQRQGLTVDEADDVVARYKAGYPAEIDPALMEGIEEDEPA